MNKLLKKKGIPIKEPFEGQTFDNGVIKILGPSVSYYTELLPNFRSTPAPVTEAISKAFGAVKEAITWIAETLQIETLDESGETSAENNSSAISLFSFDSKSVLFTSDSGIPALKKAIDFTNRQSIPLTNLSFFQVPHHGSKRNISPSILNSIKAESGYISCSADGEPKHPAKKVTNALKRRNIKPYATKGLILCHRNNTPQRPNWSSATEIPFYSQVEE